MKSDFKYGRLAATALFAMLLVISPGFAESIKGVVRSNEDNKPIVGASIRLKHVATAKSLGGKSKNDGSFFIDDLPEGRYDMEITYIGFESLTRKFELKKDINFGTMRLDPKPVMTEMIDVVGKVPLVEKKGDTLSYNSAAYKTNPDASAEDLVKKLPGMQVDTDGSVKAQGETVEQVYVDGKTFFGKDPSAALKTIPADIIEKIEVFDEESEQSKFTGFNDGNTTKTINVVTKEGKRDGWFGKIYGGYGVEDKYSAGGNINYFNGDTRISVVGLANNVNQQNFSSDDLLGVMSSGGGRRGPGRGGPGGPGGGESFMVNQYGGITQTNSFGINYSDSWGEKVEVMGSYFFNMSDNEANSTLQRTFFDDSREGQLYKENDYSESENLNHRLNFKLDWDINDNNSMMIRPSFTMQANDGFNITESYTALSGDTLNNSLYDYSSDLFAMNFSNDILFRHKFAKPMRTISLMLNTKYNTTEGESNLLSKTWSRELVAEDIDRYSDFGTDLYSYTANVDFTEPLWGFGDGMTMLRFRYSNSYQDNTSDQKAYDFDEDSDDYDFFNSTLSNTFASNYTFNQAEAGLMYRKGRDFFMMANIGGQYAHLENNQTYPNDFTTDKSFTNLIGHLMGHYEMTEKANLRFMLNRGTSTPSITQLQEVIDNSDPYLISTGNPDLTAAATTRLRMAYQYINPDNANVLMLLVRGDLQNNYIGNNIFLADKDTLLAPGILLPAGGQFSTYDNMEGYYSLKSYLTYGMPLSFIRTNLNLSLTGTYTNTPSIYKNEEQSSTNQGYGLGVTFASNISEYVDFTLTSNSNFNRANSTIETGNNLEYFNQQTSAKVSLIAPNGFFIKSDLTHQYYQGLSDEYGENYMLWNASIGYKFLKNDRMEVKLTAFDILKQNQSITRTVNDLYIEDSITDVLQQYFMLSCTYTIRSFTQSEEEKRGAAMHEQMRKLRDM
jgi:hypothetical protein